MLNRLSNRAILKVVALVGVLLATLLLASTLSAQGTAIEYAENDDVPVEVFEATDADGDPIVWSLGGDDAGDFSIPGGVLAFKSPPNFEKPADEGANNVYEVTVEASGGMHEVEVTVTNVDEDGAVSFEGRGQLQPQAGRGLVASIKDPDGAADDQEWQWAKSMDGATGWTDIEGATSASRSPAAADVGYYLRASVTYTDMFGAGKTASAVTMNAAEERTVANTAPSFSDHDIDDTTTAVEVTRETNENEPAGANIGDPVAAADADNDLLLYSIVEDVDGGTQTDDEKFDIDRMAGQLKVKTVLDFEPPGSQGSDQEYVVVIRATDPSGASGTATVTITLLDVNEAPMFADDAPTTGYVTEGATTLRVGEASDAGPLGSYGTTDDDGSADTTAYGLEGTDEDSFSIGPTDGALTFATDHTPDFEDQPTYSITITATDSNTADTDHMALTSKLDVTVMVVDAEDTGTVSFVQREPQVGKPVTAKISDPDGGVTRTEWQWAKADQTDDTTCPDSGYTLIDGATSPTYTPEAEDVDDCLQATATYVDNILTDTNDDGVDDPDNAGNTTSTVMERAVQADNAANTAPKFPDQDPDTVGDQSDSATREVKENTDKGMAIGVELEASDSADTDLLIHTLGGDDADSFDIDRKNGQIKTEAALNYEMKSSYTVMVIATDPSGASDTIAVTINVTDENDNAEITGDESIDYDENGTGPVATYTATDEDGDDIEWSLGGTDADDFTIDGGVLEFKSAPNYESQEMYMVTVEATGGTLDVTINITNMNEDGSATLSKPQPQAGRGLMAVATDPDSAAEDQGWQWARSMDGQTGWMDIEGAMSASRSPVAADVGYYLRASVTYTDMFDEGQTASVVSANVVEPRTTSNAAPSFADHDTDDETTAVEVTRETNEGEAKDTNIGDPISASDADGDVLLYSIVEDVTDVTTDDEKFDIDKYTGQLKVKTVLDYEPAGSAGGSQDYVVTILATDPSGATGEATVTISLMEVNEAPEFPDDATTTLYIDENNDNPPLRTGMASDAAAVSGYTATDDDGADADGTATWELEGPDKDSFSIGETSGTLTSVEALEADYETKDSYSITIVATTTDADTTDTDDRGSMSAKLDVTVKVVDTEDDGMISIMVREPQVGISVSATLNDQDGGVLRKEWQWAKVDESSNNVCPAVDVGGWEDITGATSFIYTPNAEDVNDCLRVTASYVDNIDPATQETAAEVVERPVQDSDPANSAPKFDDQDPDTAGDQSESATLEVAENTEAGKSIGDALTASDADGDLLVHMLDGDDADAFDIDRTTGQVMTKAALDYETKNTYMVTVVAMDPSGAMDSIAVTINVTDDDDPAVIAVAVANTAPAFDGETADRSVAEDAAAGDAVGDPVMATDADDDTLTYTLGGADAASFDIDSATGQISVGADAALDYETTTSYTVTVMAMDDSGAYDMVTVTIAVTDVDEGYNADTNGDGSIDRDEALAAVADYFADEITKAEVLAVIAQYFAE